MENFSYSNIFDTKGIEYLAILAFFAVLIPFWILLNSQVKIKKQIKNVLGVLSGNALKIPRGFFYSNNHTWTHLERSGSAKVGLDDLLVHITGAINLKHVKNPGEMIRKGDMLTEIDQNGKLLRIYSPISGKIMNLNSLLLENPELLNEDPCGKGWLYKVQPSDWIAETHSCYLAEDAITWTRNELVRFKDFMAESAGKYSSVPSLAVLQDGGELREHVLSELPGEIWNDFQKEFLNP